MKKESISNRANKIKNTTRSLFSSIHFKLTFWILFPGKHAILCHKCSYYLIPWLYYYSSNVYSHCLTWTTYKLENKEWFLKNDTPFTSENSICLSDSFLNSVLWIMLPFLLFKDLVCLCVLAEIYLSPDS